MSVHQPLSTFAEARPLILDRRAHRSFDLHPLLYGATVGSYLAYVGIMAATFRTAEMIIPTAIFVITIVAGFLVPALWARVEGPRLFRMPSWAQLMRDGMETGSGHLSGPSVVIQVLIMPAMLLLWALIIAIIRASL